MAQIFHPSMNAFAKGTIFGAVFILGGVAWATSLWVRSTYVTRVDVVRDQPVPFSHDHHVSGLGIDCRYCHTTVEKSAFAGLPSTEICMGCHSQIWSRSSLLEPVRRSYEKGEPLQWTRVHDAPDFVFFNHSIHVAKGIGCESCHGRVDRMPLMRRAASLHMEWCLDCHKHPETAVRPQDRIFEFGELGERQPVAKRETHASDEPSTSDDESAADPNAKTGEQLVEEYGIVTRQLTDCVICHR